MSKVYDAFNPRPGVLVLPCPRDRIEGLTESQRRNMRRHDAGVLRPRQRCRPEPLGMASTAKVTQPASPIVETPRRGTNQHTVRPGYRRRSPKPRTHNRVFSQYAAVQDIGRYVEVAKARRRVRRDKRREDRLVRKVKRAIRTGDTDTIRLLDKIKRYHHSRLAEVMQYAQTCNCPG